jgi:hypothetical protein
MGKKKGRHQAVLFKGELFLFLLGRFFSGFLGHFLPATAIFTCHMITSVGF